MPAARIQPQGRVRLNRANPLTRGAVALISGFSDINIATGAALSATGYAKGDTPKGRASQFRKNFYLKTETLPAIGTASFVEFWYGIPRDLINAGSGNDGALAHAFGTGSANNLTGVSFGGGSYSNPTWGAVYNWPTVNSSGEILPLNVPALLVMVRRQDRMELWRDGRLIQTFMQAPISYPASSMILGAFIENTGYWGSSSDTILAGRIVADWPADQVRSFSANPWQLFDGQPAMLSAAVAPVGGNATANPPGVAASSAVGSATVTGQAKASPAGVSAASSVGSATVSGQGRAAPAGVSATSAVGTATASGAASSTAQPAGVSAVASVGTVSASGQAKATPSGVSASATVGTATATGQAITTAYPAGVQAAAAVGSATARGTATAAPLGVSSAIYVGTAYAYGPFDLASYPKLYATTLMRLDTVNRQGGTLSAMFARQAVIRAAEAQNTLMRAAPINLTSAMRSDPINRTAGLL